MAGPIGYREELDVDDIRRKLAMAALQQGMSTEPVQHWTQGAARIAQALVGGLQLGEIDKRDKAALATLLNLPGLSGQSAVPAAPPQMPAQPAPRPAMTPGPMGALPQPPMQGQPAIMQPPGPPIDPNKLPVMNMTDPRVRELGVSVTDIPPGQPAVAPPRPAVSPVAQALVGNIAPNAPQRQSVGIPPDVTMSIRSMLANPRTRDMGLALYSQFAKPSQPTFGDIGTDPNTGQPMKGWIDPLRRSVEPAALPAQAGPSVIPQVPPGVDPKVWREEQSKRYTSEQMPAASGDASKLRNEVQGLPSYKNLAQSAPVYKSMLEAAGRDNRAADVNMIYGLAKLMDPGSVVRESEMTVAQAVATLPQQLRANIESQIASTGRLSPDVRSAIMQEAHGRVQAYQGMFDQDMSMYRGIVSRNRMNELDVIPKFGPFGQYAPAGTKPPASIKNKYGLE